jgi:PAS domain S-box-containing protein
VDQPTLTHEHRRVLPSGQARWHSWTVQGVFDAQGRLLELQAVGRDITELKHAEDVQREAHAELERRVEERTAQLTAANAWLEKEILERKRAEEALRESEERYRRMVEAAGEGIGVVDADNRFVFVNHRLAYQLGHAPQSMVGQSFLDFVDEGSRQVVVAGIAHRRGGITAQLEVRLNRSDGTPVWVLISSNPFSDEEGRHTGLVLVITEITHRKQAEQALRESEQRYRYIVEATGRRIAMTDSEERMVCVSHNLAELLGYASDEMIGLPMLSFVPEEDRAVARAHVQRHLRGAPGQVKWRLQHKMGRLIWLLLSTSPMLDTQGRYLGLVATFSDITTRSKPAARRKGTS